MYEHLLRSPLRSQEVSVRWELGMYGAAHGHFTVWRTGPGDGTGRDDAGGPAGQLPPLGTALPPVFVLLPLSLIHI